MARVVTTRARAVRILDILYVQVSDALLEIGFGPGVAVVEAACRARLVIGVDPSPVMLKLRRTVERVRGRTSLGFNRR